MHIVDRGAWRGEGGTRATSERTEGEVWADREESSRTATGWREETRWRDPVSQENKPTTQGRIHNVARFDTGDIYDPFIHSNMSVYLIVIQAKQNVDPWNVVNEMSQQFLDGLI